MFSDYVGLSHFSRKFNGELMSIVERPSSDAGPMVGGCYSLRKRVPLMKSPSKSSETQDTLKKQARGRTLLLLMSSFTD